MSVHERRENKTNHLPQLRSHQVLYTGLGHQVQDRSQSSLRSQSIRTDAKPHRSCTWREGTPTAVRHLLSVLEPGRAWLAGSGHVPTTRLHRGAGQSWRQCFWNHTWYRDGNYCWNQRAGKWVPEARNQPGATIATFQIIFNSWVW
jgi:hypothetical protein